MIAQIPDDKMPPRNPEMERGILGAVLIDCSILDEVIPVLGVDDLYLSEHRLIYQLMRDLYDAGKPVDFQILAEELRRIGRLDEVGGLDELAELSLAAPHTANAKFHAQIVQQKAQKRRLIDSAEAIRRRAYADEDTSQELQAFAETCIFDARGRSSAPAPRLWSDHGSEAIARLAAGMETGQNGGVATGMRDLDELTGGMQAGQLWVLAGRPASGKTAFALNIVAHAARSGIPIFFASLEMTGIELSERLYVAASGVAGGKCRRPRTLTVPDFQALGRAYESSIGVPLVIDDHPGRTASEIFAGARQMKARSGLGLIVVDYMQLIEPERDGGRESRQEQITKISRRLGAMAKTLEVPVLALSQLNRAVENREDHRPRVADLRESGSIEQDANLVLLLHRPEMYDKNDQPGIAEVIVAKNRAGAIDDLKMRFEGRHMRFTPLDGRNDDPPLEAF